MLACRVAYAGLRADGADHPGDRHPSHLLPEPRPFAISPCVTPTASVWAVLGILDAVAARGPVRSALARVAGLDAEALRRPDDRLPARRVVALLDAAARQAGDDFFGLHLAQRNAPQRFGILGFIFRASGTLREAYARMVRFGPLWNGGLRMHLEEAGALAHVVTLPAISGLRGRSLGARQLFELVQGGLLIGARRALDRPVVPRRVAFVTAAPPDPGPLRAFFGERLEFGAPRSEIVLDRSLLNEPLTGAEAGLAAVLTRHAEAMLGQLPAAPGPLTRRVHEVLWQCLPDGVPSLRALARRLAVSERTLQRRLAAEGRTLQALVEEARRELATRLLTDPQLSATEVAFLTGFSDASAFWRAFRRWTGTTPADFRARVGRQAR
jgi:AraC-like DNA-binding protein